MSTSILFVLLLVSNTFLPQLLHLCLEGMDQGHLFFCHPVKVDVVPCRHHCCLRRAAGNCTVSTPQWEPIIPVRTVRDPDNTYACWWVADVIFLSPSFNVGTRSTGESICDCTSTLKSVLCLGCLIVGYKNVPYSFVLSPFYTNVSFFPICYVGNFSHIFWAASWLIQC